MQRCRPGALPTPPRPATTLGRTKRGSVRAEPAHRARPAAERTADFSFKGSGTGGTALLTQKRDPQNASMAAAERNGTEWNGTSSGPRQAAGAGVAGRGLGAPCPPRPAPLLPAARGTTPPWSRGAPLAPPPRGRPGLRAAPRAVRGGRGPPGGRNSAWQRLSAAPGAARCRLSRGRAPKSTRCPPGSGVSLLSARPLQLPLMCCGCSALRPQCGRTQGRSEAASSRAARRGAAPGPRVRGAGRWDLRCWPRFPLF